MTDDSYQDMIRETTEQAREFIRTNKKMQFALEQSLLCKSVAKSAEYLKNAAVLYAEYHNNNFGELFQAELDAVDWKEIVEEKQRAVA